MVKEVEVVEQVDEATAVSLNLVDVMSAGVAVLWVVHTGVPGSVKRCHYQQLSLREQEPGRMGSRQAEPTGM